MKKSMPNWKKNKTVWGRRYGRYVEELKKLNEKSGSHEVALSRKKFKEIWKASGNTFSKQSKSVELAKSQIYSTSPSSARTIFSRLQKAGLAESEGISYWDIAKGEVSTRDLADMLHLGEEYHKKKDELMAEGMTASQASQEAKHYISWYYYGSK